jgi:hypothetical protein
LNSPEHKRVIKEIRTDMGSNPDETVYYRDVGAKKRNKDTDNFLAVYP